MKVYWWIRIVNWLWIFCIILIIGISIGTIFKTLDGAEGFFIVGMTMVLSLFVNFVVLFGLYNLGINDIEKEERILQLEEKLEETNSILTQLKNENTQKSEQNNIDAKVKKSYNTENIKDFLVKISSMKSSSEILEALFQNEKILGKEKTEELVQWINTIKNHERLYGNMSKDVIVHIKKELS